MYRIELYHADKQAQIYDFLWYYNYKFTQIFTQQQFDFITVVVYNSAG